MEKQRQNNCARITRQVEEMRRLYSRIGEPLPVDVILDLYRHLGSALELAERKKPGRGRKPRAQA